MNELEKDLEKIENQIASEKFDWFAFRCETARLIFVKGIDKAEDVDGFARSSTILADILIEELKKIE